jgi:tRNA G18 (ribose-2'-O)-methylase SpoU
VITFGPTQCRDFQPAFRAYHKFGTRGTLDSTRRVHFYTMEEACSYLRKRACTICGVEITDHAEPVQNQPFRGSTGFMVGNEGTGLTEQQIAQCDHIVYVPQYGTGASLNGECSHSHRIA